MADLSLACFTTKWPAGGNVQLAIYGLSFFFFPFFFSLTGQLLQKLDISITACKSETATFQNYTHKSECSFCFLHPGECWRRYPVVIVLYMTCVFPFSTVQSLLGLPWWLKESACNAGDPGSIPGWSQGSLLHSSVLAWRIPWTEEPSGLQSMGSQRIGQDWVTNIFTFPYCNYWSSSDKCLSTQIIWQSWRVGQAKVSSGLGPP